MKTKQTIESEGDKVEAVIGVFEDSAAASRVAASIRRADLKLQRVSRRNPTAADDLPDIVYDDVSEDTSEIIASGVLKGGAIGAGSGLLFLGVPGLNVAAPLAAALAGAWIGGIAAIDEAKRGERLPNEEDYRRLLAEGRSFIVVAGDEQTRIEIEHQMKELGATEVHQHPPVLQAIRTTPTSE